ncbi:MAG: aminoglycoside phosphotransferase family protein [Candidatus Micrarchaeota archaeon]
MAPQNHSKFHLLLLEKAKFLPYFAGGAHAEILRPGLANLAIKANWRGRDFLVKFAVAPASKPTVLIQANYEKNITRKISRLGISPAIYSFGSVAIGGRKIPYNIQEFIGGRELDYSRDLPAVARLLSKLHIATAGKRRICDYRVENCRSYLVKRARADQHFAENPVLRGLASDAGKWLAGRPPAKSFLCLIHNDLTSENVLVAKKAHLIDWGWAMYSGAAFDLCNILSPFTTSWGSPCFLKIREMRKFLREYLSRHREADGGAILEDFWSFWPAYNSLLANWIYSEFLPEHPLRERLHFKDEGFLDSALDCIAALQVESENDGFV